MKELQSKSLLSIVTPVFNEIESLPEFLKRTLATLSAIDDTDFELIFALDPSNDGSEGFLRDFVQQDKRIKIIKLSRRFGQAAAIRAGIDYARGNAIVVIDSDLQDPPEMIPVMFSLWRGGSKVVIGRRVETSESRFRKKLSSLWYGYLNRFSSVAIPRNAGDFRLIDRQIVEELKRFRESHSFFRGLVSYIGFPTSFVTYERPKRDLGQTKYHKTFGSFRIVLSGALGFSVAPLNIMFFLSLISVAFSITSAIIYATLKLLGTDFPQGNVTLFLLISITSSLNYLFLGILSLYVAYISEEVKNRPIYIVEEII